MSHILDKASLFYTETLSSKYAKMIGFNDEVGQCILDKVAPSKYKEKMRFSCGPCTAMVSNLIDQTLVEILEENAYEKINIWDIHSGFTGRFFRLGAYIEKKNITYSECDSNSIFTTKDDCLEGTHFSQKYSAVNKVLFNVKDEVLPSLSEKYSADSLNVIIIQNIFNIMPTAEKNKLLQYFHNQFSNSIIIVDLLDNASADYDNRSPISYTGVEGLHVHGIEGRDIPTFFENNNFYIKKKINIFRKIFSKFNGKYIFFRIFNSFVFKKYFSTKFCLYTLEKKD